MRKAYAVQGGGFDSPVVFKMWKRGPSAELVGGSKFWRIEPDGRTYTIDLVQGTITEGASAPGDLRVTIARPAGVSRRDRFDWSLQIVPVDGGILETKDEFMYRAPLDGYDSAYELRSNPSDATWTYEVERKFFLKARGRYARINVEVFALYREDGVFSIKYALNPTGSPTLQP